MRAFLVRFREPSTWAGVAAGLAALGVSIPGETWKAIVLTGTGIAGLAAVLLPEQPPAPPEG